MGNRTYSSNDLLQNRSQELKSINQLSVQCYFTPQVLFPQKLQNSIQNSNKYHYLSNLSFGRLNMKNCAMFQTQDQEMKDNNLIRLRLKNQDSDKGKSSKKLQKNVQQTTQQQKKVKNAETQKFDPKKQVRRENLKYVMNYHDALKMVGDLIDSQKKLLYTSQTSDNNASQQLSKLKVPIIDNQIKLLENLEILIKLKTHKSQHINKYQQNQIEKIQKQDLITQNQITEQNKKAEFTIEYFKSEDQINDQKNLDYIESIKNQLKDQEFDEECVNWYNEIYFDQLLKTLEDPNVVKTVTKDYIQMIDFAVQEHPNAYHYHQKILSVFENLSNIKEQQNQDQDFLNEQKKQKEDQEKQQRMIEIHEDINKLLENNSERVQYYSEQNWNQDEATQKVLANYADVLKKTNWKSQTVSVMDEKKELLWKIQSEIKNINERNYKQQFSQEKTNNYEASYSMYERNLQKSKQNEVNQVRETVLENIEMFLELPWNSDQNSKDQFLKQKDLILNTNWNGKSYESLKDKKDALEAILKLIQKINKDNQYLKQ